MDQPTLSVCLITYNHKEFIRKAIEGVLMQQATFTWNLIIADDFSTDGTRDILMEYRGKYPDKIQLILQEKNVGAAQNWIDLIKTPCSKYIAYFEGDDYWTDPLKLQKQVDFLESHEDYNGVFHKVSLLSNTTNKFSECVLNTDTPDSIEVTDLLKKNIIRTCSMLLRTESVRPLFTNNKFVNIFKKATPGDWLMFIFAIRHKKMKYLSDNMAVYRIHDGGIWSEAKDIELRYDKELFKGYVFLKQILPYKYFKLVFHRYAYYLGYFATKNFREKNYMNYILFKLKLYYELLRMNFLRIITH